MSPRPTTARIHQVRPGRRIGDLGRAGCRVHPASHATRPADVRRATP